MKKIYKVPKSKLTSTQVHSSSLTSIADMVNLGELSEASMLHNVRMRYHDNKIYTYIGTVLIAVNPYREIKNFYDVNIMRSYVNAELTDNQPHIYGLASLALKNVIDLQKNGKSQSLIIGGESGSGKTESSKYILQYLCNISKEKSEQETKIILENQILNANIILEAFGNAKTVRNNNSSRFGKIYSIAIWERCKWSDKANFNKLLFIRKI